MYSCVNMMPMFTNIASIFLHVEAIFRLERLLPGTYLMQFLFEFATPQSLIVYFSAVVRTVQRSFYHASVAKPVCSICILQ